MTTVNKDHFDEQGRKLITTREFIDAGYLHEVNRLVLHPTGLALAMLTPTDDDDTLLTATVWDYRDDPEGMLFGPGEIDERKIVSVLREREKHEAARLAYGQGTRIHRSGLFYGGVQYV